jgi:DNA-binding CsgD family transcriptional regulator
VTPREQASARARKGGATQRRRRDPLVKLDQQRRVVAMWTGGATMPEIARSLDISVDTVRKIRRDAFADVKADRDAAVEDLREAELQRLDRLQAAHWTRAMEGQVGSSRVVLDCIKDRAKLLGLYAPVRVDARVKVELDAQIEALMEELEAEGLAKAPAGD